MICIRLDTALVLYWWLQNPFSAHPIGINIKWVAGQWGPTVLWHTHTHTKQTAWYFTPSWHPASPNTPPPSPHSPQSNDPSLPPFLYFYSGTIVPSFSGILISPKTNESRIFLSLLLLLLLPPLLPLIFSHSLSPWLCADERQALSRQWHSKTSGLGSSVSGYSTLLGAISLSKFWPAYSPTESPQISYYTLNTEGRHSCSLGAMGVCMRAKTAQRQIEMSIFKKSGYEEEREVHSWVCVLWEGKWERIGALDGGEWDACVLQIYERCSLGCIFLKFPQRGAKCIARRFSITALKRYSTTTRCSCLFSCTHVPETLSGISICGTRSQILQCSRFVN